MVAIVIMTRLFERLFFEHTNGVVIVFIACIQANVVFGIDECASNPCLHGGSCLEGIERYTCQCVSSFTGVKCEMYPSFTYVCSYTQRYLTSCGSWGLFTCTRYRTLYQCCSGWGATDCRTPFCVYDAGFCMNGGSCSADGTCSCTDDYRGIRCEVHDPCQNKLCLNYGYCDIESGECVCQQGYSGEHCQIEINECSSSPCLNGGRCLNRLDSFECECAPGFIGHRCQTNVNECLHNPCHNGGTCADGINEYTCQCVSGYVGLQCETDINECSSNPCVWGTCEDGIDMYTCLCAAGYAGSRCEKEEDECVSDPCLNRGTCQDEINKYSCLCADGYIGNHCQIDINECDTSPCVNGGLCQDGINQFTCHCVPGYTGSTCQIDVNDCSLNPCLHEALCQDGVNEYTCQCAPGYTGLTCELEIDECSSSPCLHGGQCTDHIDKFTCRCLPGWAGENCQTDINAPIILNCSNNFNVALPSTSKTVEVTWAIPTAKSKDQVVPIIQSEGLTPPVNLTAGSHVIEYVATDADLKSYCRFTINVTETISIFNAPESQNSSEFPLFPVMICAVVFFILLFFTIVIACCFCRCYSKKTDDVDHTVPLDYVDSEGYDQVRVGFMDHPQGHPGRQPGQDAYHSYESPTYDTHLGKQNGHDAYHSYESPLYDTIKDNEGAYEDVVTNDYI